jgi:hypothetical protein
MSALEDYLDSLPEGSILLGFYHHEDRPTANLAAAAQKTRGKWYLTEPERIGWMFSSSDIAANLEKKPNLRWQVIDAPNWGDLRRTEDG